MQNVLADLEIEVEAATLLMVRLSAAFERAPVDDGEAGVARLGAAVGKYWLTERATPVVREALECVGRDGFVEESVLPRLYREAWLNSIWEGSGNVIALDVRQALKRSPDGGAAFLAELDSGTTAAEMMSAPPAGMSHQPLCDPQHAVELFGRNANRT